MLDAGVVEGAVEPAEMRLRRRDRRRHRRFVGDVGGKRDRVGQPCCDACHAVAVAVGQHQPRAVPGKHLRCCRTDAVRRTGDQDDLARKHAPSRGHRGSTQSKLRWLGPPAAARHAAATASSCDGTSAGWR